MKNFKYLIIAMLSAFTLYSCSNDELEQLDSGGANNAQGVQFTSIVEGDHSPMGRMAMARTINSVWTANDRIGIYMKKEGQALSSANIVNAAANIQHVTSTGNGDFNPVNDDERIFYPKDETSKVDFIAYYPFQTSIADYIYKIDVSKQTNQAALDLLYADNVKGASKSNPKAELKFKHMLTRLSFSINKGAGVSSLAGLKISIAGLPTLATMELSTGSLTIDAQSEKVIDVKISDDGTSAEAIVLPVGVKTFEATFTLGTTSFKRTFTNAELKAGSKNMYNITIQDSGGSVTPKPDYAMWTETPLFTPKSGLQYVVTTIDQAPQTKASKMRNYAMLYDQENRVALWIAYPLHAAYYGSSGRTDAWQYDPAITEANQPTLFSSWASYPPYNRGHQIASSDRTISKSANASTFYFSNMTLQDEKFNGGTWDKLETQARNWSGAGTDTLFVVTGVILSTKDKPTIEYGYDKGKPAKKAAIPQYFYKVLAKKVGKDYQTIGYRMPNVTPPAGDVFNNYRTTVESLEQETGYTFFPGIDSNAKKEIGSIFK